MQIAGLLILTWNARGLLALNPRRRQAERNQFLPYLKLSYIIALQEVHGSWPRLQIMLASIPCKYDFFSGGPTAGAGAVAFLFPGQSQSVTLDVASGPFCSRRSQLLFRTFFLIKYGKHFKFKRFFKFGGFCAGLRECRGSRPG